MVNIRMNNVKSWSITTKFFHWVVAALIITLIIIGNQMTDMPKSPEKFELYALHKSFGVIVMFLMVLRLINRLFTKKPVEKTLKNYEVMLSELMHMSLYVLALIIPISGAVMTQTAGYAVKVFGFALPTILDKNKELNDLSKLIHENAAMLLVVFVVIHAVAALKHHFLHKNNVLRSMLPFVKIK